MKLKAIEIRNFKCHKKINLTFDKTFTALIGENDAGKSSILDFLEFMLLNKKVSDYKDFYYKEFDETTQSLTEAKDFEGEIVFDLSSLALDEINPYEDYIQDRTNKELKIKRICSLTEDNYYIWQKSYNEEFLNNYKNLGVTALREILKTNPQAFEDISGISSRSKDDCTALIKHYEDLQLTEQEFVWGYIKINFSEIKDLLPDFIKYDSESYDKPINLVKNALELVFKNELYELEENKKGFKKDSNNQPIIRNEKLKKVYQESIKKLNDKAEEFKEYIESVLHHIEISIHPEIDFSSGFKPGEMRIKNKTTGVETNYENNGAGTKQRLYMAIFEWQQEVERNLGQNYTVKCFDEPDNNLHISAQKKLLKTLKNTTDNIQTIITTHSPFMVDTVRSDSLRLLKRDDNSETKVEELEANDDDDLKIFIKICVEKWGYPTVTYFLKSAFF